jgi:hypothetical protein
VLELERDSKREKRRGKNRVSVEGGKEREKQIRENREGQEKILEAGNDLNRT